VTSIDRKVRQYLAKGKKNMRNKSKRLLREWKKLQELSSWLHREFEEETHFCYLVESFWCFHKGSALWKIDGGWSYAFDSKNTRAAQVYRMAATTRSDGKHFGLHTIEDTYGHKGEQTELFLSEEQAEQKAKEWIVEGKRQEE
jgi:hypothetical protein